LAVLLGMDGFVVLAAEEIGGQLELLVETAQEAAGCPRCGIVALAKDRRPTLVRDLPAAGRPAVLCWVKRVWACPEPICPQKTWTERHPAIAPRAAVTERARYWAFEQVASGRTVAEVARELGVGWNTVMRAVTEHGKPRIDDPTRLDGVSRLGVDETAMLAARVVSPTTTGQGAAVSPPRWEPTRYVTGIIDLSPGRPARLLDVVDGRTGAGLVRWLDARGPDWRRQVRVAALDPFRGYGTALATALPHATRVLDAFHVVRLAGAALDEVRRRVQHEQTGHRGRATDPLYRVRRRLRRRADRLTAHTKARIEHYLAAGDPDGEVWAAWIVYQQVMAVYAAPDPDTGRDRATQTIRDALDCPIPEIQRLGRTLAAWKAELLAYFNTGGVSNGPTEAVNLLIEKTRRAAHGFRNFNNYRLRLLLTHGGVCHTPLTERIRGRRPSFVA
jgi:transposase